MSCPTCGGPVPLTSHGRPPIYCTIDCRHEMARLRRHLIALEGELVEARTHAEHEFWPGAEFWRKEAARLERAAADVRSRVLARDVGFRVARQFIEDVMT